MRYVFHISIWLVVFTSVGNLCNATPFDIEPVTWQDVEIVNTTGERQEYWLEANRYSFVDLYYSIDGGDTLHKKSGRLLPYRERDVLLDGRVILSVKLEAGQVLTGMVRLVGELYVGPLPMNRPISINLRKNRERQLWQFRTAYLVATGILLFLFAYNLVLFISTRFERYRYYLPGVLVMALEPARGSGLLSSLFAGWETYPIYDNYFGIAFVFTTSLCAPMFTRDVLDFRNRYPALERIIRYYPALCISGLILSWFNFPLSYKITALSSPILLLGTFLILTLNLIRGYRYSLFIFLGVSIYSILTFMFWIGNSGFLYLDADFLNLTLSIGTIILDGFMTLVLARMVLDLRKENALQQQRIIENLEKEKETGKLIAIAVGKAREQVRQGFARRLSTSLESQLKSIREEVLEIGKFSDPKNEELEPLYQQLLNKTQASIQKTRKIAHELMPENLGGADGLFDAVGDYLGQLSNHNIRYSHTGNPDLPLPIRALGYRILRSLVIHTLKQEPTGEIHINLSHQVGLLNIKFQYKHLHPQKKLTPEARDKFASILMDVSLFKGTLVIDSDQDLETTIIISIPTN